MIDEHYGTFSAILPAGPGPISEQLGEDASRKAREPRTRFSCLLPLPEEGTVFPVYGKGTGRRRKAAEPPVLAELPAPERPAEVPKAASATC